MRWSPPGGYFGKVLIVDLSTGSGRTAPLDESVLRSYIGGAGLGTWLMHSYCPAGIDPLATVKLAKSREPYFTPGQFVFIAVLLNWWSKFACSLGVPPACRRHLFLLHGKKRRPW